MHFFNSLRSRFIAPTFKFVHTSTPCYGADKQLLSKLRKSTGFSFLNCRKALEKFNNDIKQAETWLKDEAQKEGWAKASKLQGRPMSQGLIGLIVKDNLASMVEVNCETDFVARNLKFQSFVASVVDAVLQHGKSTNVDKVLMTHNQLNKLQLNSKSILDLTALEVGNLGENILVRRGVLLKPDKDKGQFLSYYIHTTGPKLQLSSGHCILGKYGALVICQENSSTNTTTTTQTTKQHEQDGSSSDSDESGVSDRKILSKEELGRQLCQHIVGMNPKNIGYESLNINDGDKEGIKKNIKKDSNDTKDENKDNKDEESKQEKDDEEFRLIQQEYMLDTDYKVIDVLNHNNVTILDFVRMECGEELSEEKGEGGVKVERLKKESSG